MMTVNTVLKGKYFSVNIGKQALKKEITFARRITSLLCFCFPPSPIARYCVFLIPAFPYCQGLCI